MNQIFTSYSAFFLITSLLSFFVAFMAWQRRTVKSAVELTRLMFSSGIWSIFVMFETAATSVSDKIFWSQMAYLGAVSAPVFYLLFVLRFTGKDKLINLRSVIFIFIVPVITLVLAFTNHFHNLVWPGFSTISPESNLMEYYHGIWFWIGYFFYNYLLFLLATIYLFRFTLYHSKTFKRQGIVVLIAGLIPWVSSIFYVTGINIERGLDLVPVSIMISGALFVYAILYFGFLDLIPVARETLVETLSDGIIALDSQNRIQDINVAARKFLGISSDLNIGAFFESSGITSNEIFKAVLSPEPVIMIESQGKTFKIIKQVIKNQAGSRLIVIRDITDQIYQQKEISDSEKRFKSMFSMFKLMSDNMPDMLWAKDLNKKYIFVNKAICENLLIASDTDEPLNNTDLFFAVRERSKYPERNDWHTFGELCQDSDQIVINSQKPHQFDEYGNVKGQFLFLDVHKAPIFNDDGEMVGVVGSARDVTLQKKHEKELVLKDRLLGAIAQATAHLVNGPDFDESINRALEIIGKAIEVNRVYIFVNSDAHGYQMPLMSHIYEWTDGSVEAQIDNPDLQNLPYEIACPRWFQLLSQGIPIAGNVKDFPEIERQSLEPQSILSILATPIFIDKYYWGFVGFDDCVKEREWTLTEQTLLNAASNTIGAAFLRKKNQDELIAAKEKAQESDRLKTAFLNNISHEFRTPFNGILGFLNLLKEDDLQPDERDYYIELINQSSERLLNTISDIIEISLIQSGQFQLSLCDTSIKVLLSNLYSSFTHEIKRKNIEFHLINNVPEKMDWISVDSDKIVSILNKLVSNAVKFTKQGSVEVKVEFEGDFLVFAISDTGIGIPQDQNNMIFERFIQADLSYTREFEGIGLGLSISKAYVEALGGHIWFESQQGVGTTFYVKIPVAQKNSISADIIEPAVTDELILSKKIKILIAEDDDVNFRYFKAVLSTINSEVVRSITGRGALDELKKTTDFDLILMDIKMPEMDGLTSIKEIRKLNSHIPIVVVTAYALKGDREKAIEAGSNDYLSKPVKPNEIIEMIRKYVG